jgi:membrane protein implicated in regulation of membrane protease activity
VTAVWWVLAALVLFLIEMITPGLFFFACMAVGALLAGLVTWLGLGPVWAWTVFFGGSTIMVLVVAPLARRWLKRIPPSPVGLDAMLGRRARVVEAIDPTTGQGQVRVENGAHWRAFAEDPIPVDTWVQILEVVGTRLRVSLPSDSRSL